MGGAQAEAGAVSVAKTRWSLIFIGLLIVGVALAVFETQRGGSFSVVNSQDLFYKPTYANMECAPVRPGQSVSVFVPKEGKTLQNSAYAKTTDVIVKSIDSDSQNAGSYVIKYGVGVAGSAVERTQSQYASSLGQNYKFTTLKSGEALAIQFNKGLTSLLSYSVPAVVSLNYDQYGLRKKSGSGYLDVSYTGCSVADLNKDALPDPCSGPGCVNGLYPQFLDFDTYVNYVDGWNLAFSSGNTYSYKGQEIYVLGKGQYLPITQVKVASGYTVKTVDINHPVLDSAIECSPSEPTCGSDFKIKTQVVGKTCDSYVGCVQGRLPDISGSYPSEWVEYGCVSGACQITNHGKMQCNSATPCADGYVCGSDFTCLKVSNLVQPIKQMQTPFDKLLVASALFGLVAALLVFLNSKKRNSERALVAGLSLAVGALVALAGYAVGSYLLNLPTWAVLLGVAGAGVGLYLVGGALFTILLALVLRR